MNLEQLLIKLCEYGEPGLLRMDNAWICRVKMHVAAKGASFDVKSDFDCKSPLEAAEQCHKRIQDTLAMYFQQGANTLAIR